METIVGKSVSFLVASPGYTGTLMPCSHLVLENPAPVTLPRRNSDAFNAWPAILVVINKSGGAVTLIQPKEPDASPVRCGDGVMRKPVRGAPLGVSVDDGKRSSWVELVDTGEDVDPWKPLRFSDDFTARETDDDRG
jgi:hypothetical protein